MINSTTPLNPVSEAPQIGGSCSSYIKCVNCQCGLQASAGLKSQRNYCQQVRLHYSLTGLAPVSQQQKSSKSIKNEADIKKQTVTLVMGSPSLQAADTASSDSPPLSAMIQIRLTEHSGSSTHSSVLPSSAARKNVLQRGNMLLMVLSLDWGTEWLLLDLVLVATELLCEHLTWSTKTISCKKV